MRSGIRDRWMCGKNSTWTYVADWCIYTRVDDDSVLFGTLQWSTITSWTDRALITCWKRRRRWLRRQGVMLRNWQMSTKRERAVLTSLLEIVKRSSRRAHFPRRHKCTEWDSPEHRDWAESRWASEEPGAWPDFSGYGVNILNDILGPSSWSLLIFAVLLSGPPLYLPNKQRSSAVAKRLRAPRVIQYFAKSLKVTEGHRK